MELLGYYTAAFLLCKMNVEPNWNTCMLYRSPRAFATENQCHQSLIHQQKMLFMAFDFEKEVYIKDVRCTEWLAPREKL